MITEQTGKYGAAMALAVDTNNFNYWVRQHGESLFSEDNRSLGYIDDEIFTEYITMWKELMDKNIVPNPDEWAQIETLGQEASPVVTGEGGMMFEWSNYAAKLSGVNDSLKVITPPLSDTSEEKGLWMKPGMFFSVSETSKVKKEAAKFIDWFVNSEEANDFILGERGTPSSAKVREYMVLSGNLNEKQQEMFQFIDEAAAFCGETPAPDPIGMAELNDAFGNIANAAFYGQISPEEAATNFRAVANEILERNNK
jgi:ABC-type sugar transport system, periplasmic component